MLYSTRGTRQRLFQRRRNGKDLSHLVRGSLRASYNVTAVVVRLIGPIRLHRLTDLLQLERFGTPCYQQ